MTISTQPASQASPMPSMAIPKLFYFCNFAAIAAVLPFLALYYKQLGLTGREIGLLASISPLITLLAAPLWGGLADATQQHRRLLLLAISGFLVSVLALSFANTLLWLLPIVVIYSFFSAPIIPLVDNSVLEALGEHKQEYGKQRLWGSIGWGAGAAVMGLIIERYGLAWGFYGCILIMSINLFAATRLTISRAKLGNNFWGNICYFVTSWPWLVFLITIFINGLGMSFTNNFLFLYMSSMHASKTLMGITLTATTASEVPVFFFSQYLMRRLGARGLLIAALFAQVVRMFAYALMPAAWFVLVINLLHGLTFSAMWVAAVNYANESAPDGLGATAQGLLAGISMGLAGMMGALIGGFLYDSVGPAAMFGCAGVAVLLGLLFFMFAGRVATRSSLGMEGMVAGQD
ncbi:MAG: major facilitator superfamily domain-containing protein 6 [Caldilineaceae bacterium]